MPTVPATTANSWPGIGPLFFLYWQLFEAARRLGLDPDRTESTRWSPFASPRLRWSEIVAETPRPHLVHLFVFKDAGNNLHSIKRSTSQISVVFPYYACFYQESKYRTLGLPSSINKKCHEPKHVFKVTWQKGTRWSITTSFVLEVIEEIASFIPTWISTCSKIFLVQKMWSGNFS